MRIIRLKLTDTFYIPLYNFLVKHFNFVFSVKVEKNGLIQAWQRKWLNIVAVDNARQEHLLFHVYGVYYIKLEYVYIDRW